MHDCADAAAATKQTLNAQYRDNPERVELKLTASSEVLECDNLWSGGLHEPTVYTDKLEHIATTAILQGVWDRRLLLRGGAPSVPDYILQRTVVVNVGHYHNHHSDNNHDISLIPKFGSLTEE